MFAGFYKWLSSGVMFVLTIIGAAFLVSDISGWLKADPVLVPAAVVVPAVVPAVQQVAESCACEAGAVCTGPRGGKYCTTAAGAKRYL